MTPAPAADVEQDRESPERLANDIDALSLALPDHWHSIPAIMGARAGKDIYGEKPFSHTLVEGRAMKKELTVDGLIPNDAGYSVMASLAEEAIVQALGKK